MIRIFQVIRLRRIIIYALGRFSLRAAFIHRGLAGVLESIIARQAWAKEKAGGKTAGLISCLGEIEIDQSLILDRNQGSILRWYHGSSLLPKGSIRGHDL